ncbi:MAG: sporulation protein YunB [Clostridia bacterium]|nr:sporulation protein YunB [Clostridia bacterium]
MLKKMGRRRWRIKLNHKVKFKNKIKLNNRIIGAFILFSIIILLIYIVEINIKPTVKAIAQSKANLTANEIINNTIYEEILKDFNYHDLIETHKDSENKITLIQANSIQISRLISYTNVKIKEALEQLEDEEIYIPLGQALGSYLFAAHGPKIKVKIVPVGELEINLLQDFYEAGINQTRHILYLGVKTTLNVVIPMLSERITVSTKAPIAETIIVGPVPDTVVRLDGLKSFSGTLFGK